MPMTSTQIIDQATKTAGLGDKLQTWGLAQLNIILRAIYRPHHWPFLFTPVETLSTTAAQAYTDYSALTTFWRPEVIQIRSGTMLYDVTPRKGGFAAYWGDTSRLQNSGRPSEYVLARGLSRLYWADAIPDAVYSISMLYQADEADVALGVTPKLVTHTKNGEMYLYYTLLRDMRVYKGEAADAQGAATLAKYFEDQLLAERLDDEDSTPRPNANEAYV